MTEQRFNHSIEQKILHRQRVEVINTIYADRMFDFFGWKKVKKHVYEKGSNRAELFFSKSSSFIEVRLTK